jgi:hypothetical protein
LLEVVSESLENEKLTPSKIATQVSEAPDLAEVIEATEDESSTIGENVESQVEKSTAPIENRETVIEGTVENTSMESRENEIKQMADSPSESPSQS